MDPSICIGCDVGGGGNLAATVLSVIGAVTGIGAAVISAVAFRASERNHDMAIFREEFEKHRVPLETSLGVIKRHLVTMRGSAKQLVPLATLTGNFAQVRADVWRAASEILSEASDLDDRSLVKMKWLPPLSTSAANLEQAWEVVDDPSEADQTRRQAAQTCIAVLESFSATTRSNIESCVQAALVKRGWAFGKR